MIKSIILLTTTFFLCLSCKPTEPEVKSTNMAVESSDEQVAASFEDISLEEAKQLIESMSDLVILDVRTPEEISEGKIDGALEIDFRDDNFLAEINKLEKDKKYLVYCRSGNRSGQAMDIMKNNDFLWVRNMLGGYMAWSEE